MVVAMPDQPARGSQWALVLMHSLACRCWPGKTRSAPSAGLWTACPRCGTLTSIGRICLLPGGANAEHGLACRP